MVTLLSSPIKPNNIERAEEAFIESLRNGTGTVPASVWSRLYRSLKPYLRPPGTHFARIPRILLQTFL
jgi:hypothetical protein